MDHPIIRVATCDEFETAFASLPHGGRIVLAEKITLRQARLPSHSGIVTVTGSSLCFAESVTLTLGGATVFEDVTIEVTTSGVIAADFHPLTLGKNVTVLCDLSEEKNGLYLIGGENNAASKNEVYPQNTSITVHSGRISRIVGFSRNCVDRKHTGRASLTVGGSAYVRYLIAGTIGDGSVAGSADVTLTGQATVEALFLAGAQEQNVLTGDVSLFVNGGDIHRFDRVCLSAVQGKRRMVYDPRTAPSGLIYLAELAQLDEIHSICDIHGHTFGEAYPSPFDRSATVHTCTVCGYTEFADGSLPPAQENLLFVADGGFGNGASPAYPLGDFAAAVSRLTNGGRIVLSGKCTLRPNLFDPFGKVCAAYQEPRHAGVITVTSLFGGKDYRKDGACLHFASDIDYRLSGPTVFESLTFTASENAQRGRIVARYHPLVIGEGCATPAPDAFAMDVIGGYLQFRFSDFDGAEISDPYEELASVVRRRPYAHTVDDLRPLTRFPSFSLKKEAAEAFDRMFDDMEAAGLKLPSVTDAMRSYARQYALFTGYLARLRRTFGYSFAEARRVVMRSCAVPGCSEHQLGVAVDMYHLDMTEYGGKKHHYFDITPEWAWIHEHGKEYGIVLRYAVEKTDITGCIYEAWHFRYVGKTVATILQARNLSLEEYMGAKLGLLNLDASVTVKSGTFRSVTPFSAELGLLQPTGKHFVSISENVTVLEKNTDLSEC